MADIVKKNQTEVATWDPMRALRDMMRWDPFREMTAGFPSFASLEGAVFAPSFDITENKDAFLFKADLPGVKKENLTITASGNRLQIAGRRDHEQETKTDTVYAYERQYGAFQRSFTMPEGADLDHATSELKDGVLTLAVPKKASAQAKRIAISTGSKS